MGEHHLIDRLRALLTVTIGVGLLVGPLAAGAPVAPRTLNVAGATLHVEETRIVAGAELNQAAYVPPPPCEDRLYRLEGGRWTSIYRWLFRASSTPAGVERAAAESTIRHGVVNIVRARNDCGRPDRVTARARYMGRTSLKPSCRYMDGWNVIGFKSLRADVAARACWWVMGSRIVEADVQINSNLAWATSLAGCTNQLMLEAVATHEAGHVFGLAHVGEARHGRLTMSPFVDGPCNNQESTLGLGDLRGLEALYP
jgi:hypothetical protein